MRDETQKHGQALQAASQKKASPEELCKLFKVFLAAETKMLKGLEDQSTTCGVPPKCSSRSGRDTAGPRRSSKQVCEVAAQGPRPSGPSLSDALGTTPVVPDTNVDQEGPGHLRHAVRQSAGAMTGGAGRVADSTGNWVDGFAPAWTRPYLRLARLDRPIGSWLSADAMLVVGRARRHPCR